MSRNLSSSSPMQPLSIGNVVTAGVRLYSSNLKTYLKLALFAHLWVLVPIYGWAKYAAISGLISRLAFAELTNQPESINTARSKTNRRLWSFFIIYLRVWFLLTLVLFALLTLSGLAAGALVLVFGWTFEFWWAYFLVGIVVLGILLVGLTWFYSRWVIAEVPLAVEDGINASQSIARSWDLTQNSVLRVQGVVVIAAVITLPIIFLFNFLPEILLEIFEDGSMIYGISYLLSLVISLAGGILVLPFWQAIKAVLYYDLRTRREGFGLNLHEPPTEEFR